MSKDAVINLRIDSELKRKLQEKCYDKRLKMTEAIEQAIEQWLNEDSTQSTQSIQDDSAAAQDIPDRADEIDELKNILIQQQEQLDQHQHSLDNSNLEERLERLENKQSENYQAIARLQNTYPEYVNQTKQLKDDMRTLKYETQQLKINRASMNDIRNLEIVIEQKIDQQQLDERLSMATMPIWEQIDANPNSASQDYSSLEVVDETNNNECVLTGSLRDSIVQEVKQEYAELKQTNANLGKVIGNKLIENDLKENSYKVDTNKFSIWSKTPPNQNSKHYYAYLIWRNLISTKLI